MFRNFHANLVLLIVSFIALTVNARQFRRKQHNAQILRRKLAQSDVVLAQLKLSAKPGDEPAEDAAAESEDDGAGGNFAMNTCDTPFPDGWSDDLDYYLRAPWASADLTQTPYVGPEDYLTALPTGKIRCCATPFGKNDASVAECDTSSCVNNFGLKNLNCFNYGSPQHPVTNDTSDLSPGGSNNCPYTRADKAICDVSYYVRLNNGNNCRDHNGNNHCLGKVRCLTGGVDVPKKGNSNGMPGDGITAAGIIGDCPSSTYAAGADCFYNGNSENWKVCGAKDDDDSTTGGTGSDDDDSTTGGTGTGSDDDDSTTGGTGTGSDDDDSTTGGTGSDDDSTTGGPEEEEKPDVDPVSKTSVDCVGEWLEASECSAVTGSGQQLFRYVIYTNASNGGKECEAADGSEHTSVCTGVKEDPHFLGFDGSKYDFQGLPGSVFNIISDQFFQCNARFVEAPRDGATYMGVLGVKVDINNNIILTPDIALVNDHLLKDGETRRIYDRKGKEAGLVRHNGDKIMVKTNFFQLDVTVMHLHGFQYLNLGASVHSDHISHPHGLLGQTAQYLLTGKEPEPVVLSHKKKFAEGFLEGTATDYLVSDGPLGKEFFFNRYGVAPTTERIANLPARFSIGEAIYQSNSQHE